MSEQNKVLEIYSDLSGRFEAIMEQRHDQMIGISTPKDSVERQKPAVETE